MHVLMNGVRMVEIVLFLLAILLGYCLPFILVCWVVFDDSPARQKFWVKAVLLLLLAVWWAFLSGVVGAMPQTPAGMFLKDV